MKARGIIQILTLTATQLPSTHLSVLMDGLLTGMNGATWCFLKRENKQWNIISSSDASVGKNKWTAISEEELEKHLVSATVGKVDYKNEDAKNVMFITHCVDDNSLLGFLDTHRKAA